MQHRLEFRAGTSAKFWQVAQTGNKVVVTFGRIGTAGQAQERAFGSPAQARADAEKQLAAKLAKGYRAVKASKAAKLPAPTPRKVGASAYRFLFVGDGFGTSYKCLECYAWFERKPTAAQQAKIKALLPLPLTSVVKFHDAILHFGSDDELELRVKAAYEPAYAGVPFKQALKTVREIGVAHDWSDAVLFPSKVTWKAFCAHFERAMVAIDAIVPLRLALKPDEEMAFTQATRAAMIESYRVFEPVLATKAKPALAQAWLTLNLVEGFDDSVLRRMTPHACNVWLAWIDRLHTAGPRDLRDEFAELAGALVDALPAKERAAAVAKLSRSTRAMLQNAG